MKNLIIITFVTLALIVSFISTLHAVEFFLLSNGGVMSIFLALAFEVGQIASSLAIMNADKMNMRIVWGLSIFLTLFQVMGNVFYSYKYLTNDFTIWSEVFFLGGFSEIAQKRIIAFISGGFLPIISAGFLKSLSNYLKSFILGNDVKETPIENIEKVEMIENEREDLIDLKILEEEKIKSYLLGRKESECKNLKVEEIEYYEIPYNVLRIFEKDFKLRFDRVKEVEPKLKSLKVLNTLIEKNDLDTLKNYLTYNKSIAYMLSDSLIKMEQKLKNANIY